MTFPRFPLGQLVATPGALAALDAANVAPILLIFRHGDGDWGELDDDDRRANDAALVDETRILSAYTLPTGVKLWIITEADRSATTILLPSEY